MPPSFHWIRTCVATAVVALLGLFVPVAPAPAQSCTWGGTTTVAAPSATHLRGESEALRAPGRVAVDSTDNLYVTDPDSGRVVVRNAENRLISIKTGFDRPLAIAVDSSAGFYVSDLETGSVGMFDSNWDPVGELGSGTGEFVSPNDLAIDWLDNSIYVSDGGAHLIKVYSSGGVFQFSFGGRGSGDGQLDHPGAVLVTAAGEVWVADQNNDRVQVFDRLGTFQRCFGYQAGEARKFGRIEGLTEDSLGRIYLSDAFHGQVRVVDDQGVELTTIGGFDQNPGELRTPMGLVIDSNNRLFAASHNTGQVEVFGLDTFSDPLDSNPEGTLQFATGAYSASESDGWVTVTVNRTGGSAGLAEVAYRTANGSARAGLDYSATTGTVSFADGDATAKTFQIAFADDTTYEGDETFGLELLNPVGAAAGVPAGAVVTILEDDPDSGVLQFGSAVYGGSESGAPVTVTVTRIGAAEGPTQVAYATFNGSATGGLDFTPTAGTVSFGHLDASPKSFQVVLADDALLEGSETLTLLLTAPTGGATLGIPGGALLTIWDDESSPPPCGPTLELTDMSVTTTETFEASETIWAGHPVDLFEVLAGGDATLYAGDSVILNGGFVVEAGASLVIAVDPAACGGGN